MSEDQNLVPFTLPLIFGPVLDRLEGQNEAAAKTVRQAIERAEAKQPGVLLETAKLLLKRSELNSAVNIQEVFLRHQADVPADQFAGVPPLNRRRSVPPATGNTDNSSTANPHAPSFPIGPAAPPSQTVTELTGRAHSLRKILARIPDEMSDRRKFLETIKEIASCIKKLLDATNALLGLVPPASRSLVEQRKREFVKYSKRFSNTLKEYFKGDLANSVFVSANQLIYQTGLIVKVARELDM